MIRLPPKRSYLGRARLRTLVVHTGRRTIFLDGGRSVSVHNWSADTYSVWTWPIRAKRC